MVKTRTNKKPNKLFEKDFVSTSGKVAKKQRKKPNILSPRSKRGLSSPSDATSSPDASPDRKRTRHSTEEDSDTGGGGGGLTIVFARKRSVLGGSSHHHVKKSKNKKSKHRDRHIEEDPRSTSASFKRKGMDRVSRPDSPTRGIDEIDRIKYAIDEIKSGAATSVQKAACKWRIHADKLYRRLKGTVRIDGRNGPPPVLSRAEEDKLTTWIITMSERGFPVSSGSLRNTVQNFLKQDKRKNPFTDDKPSMSWYKAFVRRNPKVRTVSSMMLTRSCKSLEGALIAWYNELDTFLRCLDIIDRPEKIWHFVAIDLYAAPSSSAASSQPNGAEGISTREKVCTCIVSANAAGHVIPPFFVFRGHCVPTSWDPLVGAPLSSGILFSQLGSASKTVYSDWLENHFLPNIGPDRPTVLLLDCPEGHIDVDVFVTAQQNDIHMFRIIPSIADLVCPVPEEMLKTPWEKEAAFWNASHPLVPVSAKNAARIVGKAWPKIDQPAIIAHNFRMVGIFPVDSKVTKNLVKEKYRKDREVELVESVCALKPAQSLIDLELFESNLDRALKEEYHRQLIAKDSENETEHFREWKQLYEAVYGKIIPVQDVPVAEEEVTVSYVEHILDDTEVMEAGYHLQGQPVTVEIKEEYDPSQVVLSNDLSLVPRDVINVALTMATDIATYRTEGSKERSSQEASEPAVSDNDTVTTMAMTTPASIPTIVLDDGEVTRSEASALAVSQPPESTAGFGTPKYTSPSLPSTTNQKADSNVPPVPKNTVTPTIVNVIRVTPGEKRDVSKSNIAVHQTPVSTGKVGTKISASGLIKQVAKAASNLGSEEEALPMIHISDTGEVSVVPAEETRGEVVEVTDVVEVDNHSFRGLSADQVLEQIQVSEMEVVSESPEVDLPGGGAVVMTEHMQQDDQGVLEGNCVAAGTPDIVAPQEMAMEIDVISDTVTSVANTSQAVTDTEASTVSTSDVGSLAADVTSGTVNPQSVQTAVSTVKEAAVSSEGDSESQAAVVSQSTETSGFGGLGEVPLMQGDVIVETEAVDVSESGFSEHPEECVTITTDGVNSGDPGATSAGTKDGPGTVDAPLMQGDVVMEAVISDLEVSKKLGSDVTTVNNQVSEATETETTNQLEEPGDAPLLQGDVVMEAVVSDVKDSNKLKSDVTAGTNEVTGVTEVETADQVGRPGDIPLLQGSVVTEAAEMEPEHAEGSDIVITVDSTVTGEGDMKAASAAGTVEVIQQSTSSHDEMGEILAPSTEESTTEAPRV